ncbi:MAG TPA: peptide MFS transporter [Cyclobacteriaceae bacterium]
MTKPKTFFGHPIGLATLFFVEMWERFSYYGMRALLLLFMVATVEEGGMGLDIKTGTAIYGLYTMCVYLFSLPGGWLADKFFGLRKAIFYGGCIIALGHVCLALPYTETFFIGLALIVIGTGLLKPNASSIVGSLYTKDEQIKRDAGFSLFYMGINSGAFISPIITGYLRLNYNWHYGFIAAGLGMVIGLIQYKFTEKNLGDIGLEPVKLDNPQLQKKRETTIKSVIWFFMVAFAALVFLLSQHIVTVNPVAIAQASAYVLGISFLLYFIYVFLFEKLVTDEKKKIFVIGILFIFSCMFWAGYEQQGSSLNLFAQNYTDLFLLGKERPAEWFQSVPPIFVIIFSSVFAWLWIKLSKKNINPSTPVKFSLGLLFMGAGYAVMMGASLIIMNGQKALPSWLIITYLLHTFGEICLYPVGLSAVTKLSPKKLVGQMMGIWFMSIAFGNLVAGLFAGEFDEKAITQDPHLLFDLFWVVVKVMLISGLIVLILNKPIRKLMGDIK